MDRDKLKEANAINEKLTEVEEFYNNLHNLKVGVEVSNGGEGTYVKRIPSHIETVVGNLIRNAVSSEIRALKGQLQNL